MLASRDSKGINLNYFSVCKIYYKILNYVQMYVHACVCMHVCVLLLCVYVRNSIFHIPNILDCEVPRKSYQLS